VEDLCNRVAIIRTGTILFDGELDELLKSDGEARRIRVSDVAQAATIAAGIGIATRAAGGDELELTGDDEQVARYTIALGQAGVAILELSTGRGSLEHLFFQLTEGEPDAHSESPAETPQPVAAAS
jgi:ABC-type multidrug transport system ATPase subunit